MGGWTRRLQCPKCHAVFDYEFIPGASFTAVRLGTSRYLRCPICRRFSVFPMSRTEVPGLAHAIGTPASKGLTLDNGAPATALVPKFSDVAATARWTLLLLIPFVLWIILAVLFLPKPEPALVLSLVGAAGFIGIVALLVYRSRLTRVAAA